MEFNLAIIKQYIADPVQGYWYLSKCDSHL